MYVIAGVSGRTGAIVAETLLQAGQRVRVVVRDPAKGEKWRARGAEVAVASLEDEPALARALAGATGAYLLSPQDPASPDPITTGWRIAHAVARAIERSAVGHVVLLSSLGAQHAEGTGLALTLHAAEERLAGVGSSITFLRAACFLENWAAVLGATAGGKLPTFIRPDQELAMVSVRDVGAVAARALLEAPGADRRNIIELAGPCDYSPRALAAILTRLVGKPVVPEHVPLEAVVATFIGFGASLAYAEQVRLLYQGIGQGKLAAQGGRVLRGSAGADTVFADLLVRSPS
jgi:uncharacterized protein YbjT (DUF2867 family)